MMPRMGDLRDNESGAGQTYASDRDKARHLAERLWTPEAVSDQPPASSERLIPPRYPPGAVVFSCRVTPEEVNKVLRNLKSRKAPGPGEVRNEALIRLAAQTGEDLAFERYLADLFTACLTNSHYPDIWKIAKTSMVPKSGRKRFDLASSWRPIALLSCIGKVLERIIADQLGEQKDKGFLILTEH